MSMERYNDRIDMLKTDDLIPYVNNTKEHPDEQVNIIASSIKEFGFINPIIVDKGNSIIAGHGRLLAAKKLGLEVVPVLRVEHLTPAQTKAYRIADNRLTELGKWDNNLLKIEISQLQEDDFDLDILGFDSGFIEGLLIEQFEGLTDPDEIPDNVDSFVNKGEIWQLGRHWLMCGDCTDADAVARLMQDKKIDMIFTDPPYGVSYAGKNEFLNHYDKGNCIQKEITNDHLTINETRQLWLNCFALWNKYLAEYSSYYICSPQGCDLFSDMMDAMSKAGMPARHVLVWAKNSHVLGRCDYNYKHEPILYGWSKRHKFYGGGEQKTSVWNYNKPLKNDLHPTMKPVELVENAILNSTQSGNNIVADMFLGSGTTLIAAEKTGRICYGMELDEHYCSVIIRRWEQFTGQKAVKIE